MAHLARRAAVRAVPIAAFALILVALDHSPADAAPAANAPPAAFSACASCHSVVPGRPSFGPNLSGVSGRQAGSLAGYAYSPALKASGLKWDADTLSKWVENPRATVPGNKMPYAGMKDAARRQQIVDYLATLK